MTTRELSTLARPGLRGGLRALDAQRLIDFLTLRLAPSAAAGLIGYSHMNEVGQGLIVFACMLIATQAIEHPNLPLHLMPASRVLLAIAAPVVGATAAWLVALAAGDSYPITQYSAVVAGAWLVLALGAWMRVRLEGGLRARVAVIGSREFAADFAAELAAANIDKYDVVGWVGGQGPAEYRRLRWLGPLADVREAVVAESVDLLVCAPTMVDADGGSIDDVCARVADECLDLPVRLIAANQLYEEVFGHVPVGTIDAAWYRYIMHPRFRAAGPISKRVFDLFFGSLIALFFLPAIAVAALAIKLGDGGPVLYRQRRLGEYGREFDILKLRTMRVDAERNGPQWATAEDDRITRVGRLLRRTHLDEVPQLWNVLRGEMSLVGPRPERPIFVEQFERELPRYAERHRILPGITGLAQINGFYHSSPREKLRFDLMYMYHPSLWMDVCIIVRTALGVFK